MLVLTRREGESVKFYRDGRLLAEVMHTRDGQITTLQHQQEVHRFTLPQAIGVQQIVCQGVAYTVTAKASARAVRIAFNLADDVKALRSELPQ
jgi:sRNA-binding carbon storage regulator CsrA